MASENGSFGKDVTLVAFGAAIGAALGVLLAPKAGKETRRELLEWLKDRREKGGELLGRIRERLPEKKERFVAAVKAGKQAYYETANGRTEEKEAVEA